MLLSVLIPAYQEEGSIAEVLRRVCAIDTESFGFEKEIIVCDDGSADRTAALVEQAAAGDARIRLVRHPQNRGKGAAIRSALEHAQGDYCLIQDADLEYEVSDYPAILMPLHDGADVVYGSRFLARRHPEGMRLPNLMANRILTFTANLLFGLSITDEATCFKAFRTDLLRSLRLRLQRLRVLSRGHGQARQPPGPHCRGPDLLLGTRRGRGQEGALDRWLRGHVGADQAPRRPGLGRDLG